MTPKPMPKVAFTVRMKIELAAIRWRRSTRRVMAMSSAGPKKALMVEIAKFRTRMANTLAPSAMNSAQPTARPRLDAIMIQRASLRSTMTPASALKTTAGTRKVRIRSAFAVFEPVALTTTAMSAARTMLPAS